MTDCYTFDDANRAIDILRHDIPAPWINYLSNGRLHAFVSQAAGGMLWWHNPAVFRITRYRMYNLPIDSPGFYIYIRQEDGTYWSPSFRPCETPLDQWSARHQPGKTTFTASKNGITATLTLFIAPDHDALVWDLELKNGRGESVNLDVFAYAELSQLDWGVEQSFGYYTRSMLKTWHDADLDAQLYLPHHSDHRRLDDCPLVYLASTRKFASYSGDRDAFVGNYRFERNPQGVENNHCGNHSLQTGEPCAAGQVKVALAAGGRERIVFSLGVISGALRRFPQAMEGLRKELACLRGQGFVDQQMSKLDAWWQKHLSAYSCQLPDADVQRQVNIWSPVQCVHTGRYSRSISSSSPGIRGMGYRDTAQDMLAVAYRDPAWAQEILLVLLGNQYEDGHAVHATFTEERRGPWTDLTSDDHLWAPMLAHSLIRETGDLSLLQQKVPFLATDHQSPVGSATVWEHLLRAVKFTSTHLGAHGIPLTLKCDWNDVIGRFARKGKGESIMAAQQYVIVLRDLLELAKAIGDSENENWLTDLLDQQVKAIEACAWDGEWWRRGFDDDGSPVGTASAAWGQVFLNPQSWAVLSGIGTREQWIGALDVVKQRMDTGVGLVKVTPGFKTFPEVPDPFVGYNPGCGENGAVFCHANTWVIIAEALLGRAERAWEYYTNLVPHRAIQKVGVQRYQAEPYAYVSNIIGPENTRFGWANVTQVTGTATWMDVAVTQYLLGVRPEIRGLRIDPCIPADWDQFTVNRHFRGCDLHITVRNPDKVTHGVKSIMLDGKELDLSQGPVIEAGVLHGKGSAPVTVTMGVR